MRYFKQVEHSCYKCQTPVPEGKVFCPECRAPQIRVMLPEVTVPQVPISYPDRFQDIVDTPPHINNSRGINWSHAIPSAAVAGVIAAALMMFPLGAFGLGMVASGALATIIYYRRTMGSNVTFGVGAILGAMSGMIGFAIFTVFVAIVTLIAGTDRLHNSLLNAVSQYAAQNKDPQQLQMLEYFKTPSGLTFILIVGLFFLFLMFLVFSTVGGLLGTAWVRRRKRP